MARLRGLAGAGLAALLVGAPAPRAAAAEIDSFTGRDGSLPDQTAALDGWLNARIREGVEAANARAEGCDAEALREEVRRAFFFPFIGHWIAEDLNGAGWLAKRRVLLEDSVYRDLGLLEAVSLHWKDLSAVVRVGEALVGVDKLGHFLVEGWASYEIAALEGEGAGEALAWGERAERSYFGLLTTGIYSYADLVANWEGLRFWSHLVAEGPAPLAAPEGADPPYVACEETGGDAPPRWRLRREVALADYVSPVWDEAVNCSRYRSDGIAERIHRRVAELGADLRCPMRPAACAAARERYGARAERLLHPRCLAAEPPWWHPLWPPHWDVLD